MLLQLLLLLLRLGFDGSLVLGVLLGREICTSRAGFGSCYRWSCHEAVVAYFGRTDAIIAVHPILQRFSMGIVIATRPKNIESQRIALPGLLHEPNDVSEDVLAAHLHRIDVEHDVSIHGHDNVVLPGRRLGIAMGRGRRLLDDRVRARRLLAGLDEVQAEAGFGIGRIGPGQHDISDQLPPAPGPRMLQILVTSGNDGIVVVTGGLGLAPALVRRHCSARTGGLGSNATAISRLDHCEQTTTRLVWT